MKARAEKSDGRPSFSKHNNEASAGASIIPTLIDSLDNTFDDVILK